MEIINYEGKIKENWRDNRSQWIRIYNLVSVNKYNESGYPIIYGLDEVELIQDTSKDKEIDWEQRRFELIKVALSGYCSKPEFIKLGTKQIARYTINTVDELIKELKLR